MKHIREHGTFVIVAANPEERVAAIREIVARGQYAKVDGTMIDLFSASAIISVYERVVQSDFVRAPAVAVADGRILPSVPCKLHSSEQVMFQWLSERGQIVMVWKEDLCQKI